MAETTKRPEHPALIINPHSGGGKAEQFGLVGAARALGIEAVVLEPDDDRAALAEAAVDRGVDHLMMAGDDGSLGVVAELAVDRGTTFGCVPVGTRNHFAMEIGLDRDDPLAALQAVMEPGSLAIDYERIDNRCSSSREAPRSFDRSSRRARDPSTTSWSELLRTTPTA